ncbi:MAG: hypothetical protein WAO69_09635 [Aestuariivita sp.]
MAPVPLAPDTPRAYNPAYERQLRDHYSNYIPGALTHETPGQGV